MVEVDHWMRRDHAKDISWYRLYSYSHHSVVDDGVIRTMHRFPLPTTEFQWDIERWVKVP